MSPRGRPSRKQRDRAEAAQRPAPTIAATRVFEIARGGERLDKLVATQLPELSRARVQALVEQGLVLVDGVVAKGADRPARGRVEVRLPEVVAPKVEPVALGLKLLYEDAHLLVLDKPAGISVHPGAGEPQTTLVHGLLHQIADLAGIGGELRPGIVHRLDKDTSGCLAVAKTEPALRGLQEEFAARRVEKRYIALVHGAPPEAGEFDTLHARHPTDRKRFSTKVREGKRAVTRYRMLARGDGAALVEIELLTGRTHQIRAHFADAGFPLVADAMYGGTRRESRLAPDAALRRAGEAIGRQALHAARLAFEHPITGVRVACDSPLPPDFRAALTILGINFGD